MSSDDDPLTIYAVGPRTVLGFGGQEIVSKLNVSVYRDHLLKLIDEHSVDTVAFDLTGIVVIPSGLLGLLASLRELNVTVELFNPSDDVSEVLAVTRLDELLHVRQGDPLEASESEAEDGDKEPDGLDNFDQDE
jgi:anti-anti-sigma regulatory factor